MRNNLDFNFFIMGKSFYINFNLENKQKGTENIYLKNSRINGESIINYNEINDINKVFVIQDDYNDKNSTNRIGTTIINLLNKSRDMEIILNKGLEELTKIDEIQIKKLCIKLEEIINKFKLKQYNANEILDNLYVLIEFLKIYKINKGENIPNYEMLEYISKIKNNEIFEKLWDFYIEVYSLKKEFCIDDVELNIIIEKIMLEEQDVEEFYYYDVSLEIVKNTMKRIQKCKIKDTRFSLNEVLKCLVNKSFYDFNNDYQMVQDKQKMQEFFEDSQEHYNTRPYNTYYKNISIYMNNLLNQYYDEMKEYKRSNKKDKILPQKFKNFSYIEMAKIFIQSFIEDLKFMNRNYNSHKLDFSYIRLTDKLENEFNISSFGELFYISKYFISKVNYKIKKCNLCNRFFIAEISTNSNCERIYKEYKNEKITCREYADRNNKSYNKIVLERMKNEIEDILDELFENDRIESKDFNNIREYYESLEDKKDLQIILEDLKEKYNFNNEKVDVVSLCNKWKEQFNI